MLGRTMQASGSRAIFMRARVPEELLINAGTAVHLSQKRARRNCFLRTMASTPTNIRGRGRGVDKHTRKGKGQGSLGILRCF